MKSKKLILSFISVLFLFVIISLGVFSGCEKELATSEVAVDRTFKGRVVEFSLPTKGIANATVSITIRAGVQTIKTEVTDNNGNFNIILPAFSGIKTYFIHVEKDGYYPVDTFANCNCDILTLPTMKLIPTPLDCGIVVPGLYSGIKDSAIAVGETIDFSVNIQNIKKVDMILEKVTVNNSDIIVISTLPLTIPANSIRPVTFRFTPTKASSNIGTILWKIACDSTLYSTNFEYRSDSRRCEIEIPDAKIDTNYTFEIVTFVQLQTKPVIIKNISNVNVNFIFSQLNPAKHFIYLPLPGTNSGFTTTLPALTYDSVLVKFSPPGGLVGNYVDTLTITSNGGCSRKVILIGIYNEIIIPNLVLVRWDQNFRQGYRFSDNNLLVTDSVDLCPTQPPTGTALADFRFIGGVYAANGQPLFATLQAANGMKRLGNINKDGKNFSLVDYPLTDKLFGWTNYCNQNYELGDVIAVRTRTVDYALILIDNFYQFGSDGKEKLIFKSLYPVP